MIENAKTARTMRRFPYMIRGVAQGATPSDVRNFLAKVGPVKDLYLPLHHVQRTPRQASRAANISAFAALTLTVPTMRLLLLRCGCLSGSARPWYNSSHAFHMCFPYFLYLFSTFSVCFFLPYFRNYCFFDFENEADGERAMKELQDQMFMGYRITVHLANSDPKTPDQMVKQLQTCKINTT